METTLRQDHMILAGKAVTTVARVGGATVLALLLSCQSGCNQFSTRVMGIQDTDLVTAGFPDSSLGQPPVRNDNGEIIQVSADGMANHRPPAELSKVSLPPYRIEPPDVLLIDAIRAVPKDPYFIQTTDVLQVIVVGTLPDQPIAGGYQVEPSGLLNLGPSYGAVRVEGLSVSGAEEAIRRQLQSVVTVPEVSVSLLQASGQQLIQGEHLVGPDGTVNLGIYGSAYIAGMTVDEARQAIEDHLGQHLESPEVALDVFAYNSKVYYIVTEGAGFGETVVRVPITGNETVLDAVAGIGGLQRVSSTRMWISRPAPHGVGCDQILPIDWQSITRGAVTSTNYQLMPGDRLFVAEDRLIAIDSLISKILNPIERMFGFTLLGVQTIGNANRLPQGLGNI